MEVGKDIDRQSLEIPDSDEYVFVGVNTYGVTRSDTGNPVLKTVYLNTCVGLVLYDRDSKVAGLGHISPVSQRAIRNHIEAMVKAMGKHGFDTGHKLEAHLVGSWEDVSSHIPDMYIPDTSLEDTIAQLKKVIGTKFDILTKEKTQDKPHDIAFDSRDGMLYHLKEAKRPAMRIAGKFKALVNPVKGAWITPDKRTLS